VHPSSHILEDAWTVDDKQNQFSSYAHALSRFLERINDKNWKAEIDGYPMLESMINKCLADKCFKKFFERQTKLKHEERLSSSKVGIF